MDGHLFCGGFIECALPPLLEIVDGVGETFCAEVLGAEVDDGHLLSACGRERDGVGAGNDATVVGYHFYIDAFAVVFYQQTDVPQSVAFA